MPKERYSRALLYIVLDFLIRRFRYIWIFFRRSVVQKIRKKHHIFSSEPLFGFDGCDHCHLCCNIQLYIVAVTLASLCLL